MKIKIITLNSHEVATVLDALCLFVKTYEGKDADCKRTAYMEHFGCTCGDPLVSTNEIKALHDYINMSPEAADDCRQKQYELAIKKLTEENYRLNEAAEFWQGKVAKLILPSAILELDKPPKE
jgi:hypothetical protein